MHFWATQVLAEEHRRDLQRAAAARCRGAPARNPGYVLRLMAAVSGRSWRSRRRPRRRTGDIAL